MRKETWAVAGLGLLVIVLTVIVSESVREPRYRGESFDYWLAVSESPDELVRAEAYKAFGALHAEHPRAISTLLMRLEREGSQEACVAGIDALGRTGPVTEQVIPVILSVASRMKTQDIDKSALQAIGRFEDAAAPAFPFVIAKLRDASTRGEALKTVRSLGKAAAPIVPVMSEIAASSSMERADFGLILDAMSYVLTEDRTEAEWAAIARAVLDQPDTARHETLVSVAAGSYRLRRSAMSKAICEKISPLLSDPEKRAYALNLLSLLKDGARSAVPEMEDLLLSFVDSEESIDMAIFVKCLNTIVTADYSRGYSAANKLIQRLEPSKPLIVRKRAVLCLSAIGWSANGALPKLREMLEEQELDPALASSVEEAIRRISRRN